MKKKLKTIAPAVGFAAVFLSCFFICEVILTNTKPSLLGLLVIIFGIVGILYCGGKFIELLLFGPEGD